MSYPLEGWWVVFAVSFGTVTLCPTACTLWCFVLEGGLIVSAFVVDGLGAVLGAGGGASGHGQCACRIVDRGGCVDVA